MVPLPSVKMELYWGSATRQTQRRLSLKAPGFMPYGIQLPGQRSINSHFFKNDDPIPGSTYGTGGVNSGYTGMVIINAGAGDQITLRNHTSAGPVTLDNAAGGTETGVSASVMILKIGAAVTPDPQLEAVNNAQDIAQMRAAITDPALGLDLDGFDSLSTAAQDMVLGDLLANRPDLGYMTVAALQETLDKAVNETVDPENIRVKAGSVGGDGSLAHPFGTISRRYCRSGCRRHGACGIRHLYHYNTDQFQ